MNDSIGLVKQLRELGASSVTIHPDGRIEAHWDQPWEADPDWPPIYIPVFPAPAETFPVDRTVYGGLTSLSGGAGAVGAVRL